MEIKYTTDGKKVVVLGNLNSQEKIVQEIFVIDGKEIPSGENFVVKSLHDAPAISWKEKRIKEIDDEYKEAQFRQDNEIKTLKARFKTISSELREKISESGKLLKNVSPESFDTLVNYLTGEIKWIVKTGYSPELIEFKDFIQTYEDKLRLVSLYGRSDGSLTYAIGEYSDWSGGHKIFKPFVNYEDALVYFKNQLLQNDVSWDRLKMAKQYNIELNKDKIEKFKNNEKERMNKDIENWSKSINTYKEKLEELNNI